MTAMPGSSTRTASPDAALVARFSATERALHWTHATAFFGLLASGLVLYLPSLSEIVSRGVAKTVHLAIAVGWMVLVTLVVALGDHAGVRRTLREIDRFDDDDGAWLRG